jgi:integrase
MPGGSKLWRMAYRHEGKQKKLAIGVYPAVSLSDAREERRKARALLASGTDPGQQRRLRKLERANVNATSFRAIAADLLAKKRREGKASATIGKREWLHGIANADLGDRPIAEIKAIEVLAVLRKVEAKGNLETARRLKSVMSEVFRHAIPHLIETDPTSGLKGKIAAPKVKHRAALTDAVAFGALLRAIDGFQGQPGTIAALRLMALLFPRPGELRAAQWSEFDLDKAIWTIPALRTKMRREHRVPLSRQAIAIIEGNRLFAGESDFVFPHISNPARPMSENTMNGALRRLGYGADEMVSHGFRATASTLLNESGKWSPDAIERALGHQDEDAVRRVYARGAFWDERVRMMQWWADHLDTLRNGAVVIEMKPRGSAS